MAKYGDAHKVGNSDLVPFKPDETPKERHERRKNAAADAQESIAKWCEEHTVEMIVSNDGHHWRFLKEKNTVEWWPSSAKMVVNKRWKDGLHVHDFKQVISILTRVFS